MRLRAGPLAPVRRRFLLIAVLLSVGLHLAAAVFVVFLPRILPHDAPPQEEGTVELLMVERKGAEPGQPGQPNETQPVPPRKAEAPKTETPETEKPAPEATKADVPANETAAAAPPPAVEHGDEPVAPASKPAPSKSARPDTEPAPRQARAEPVPPRSQQAPVFDLEGTDSDSNATAMGDHVLPAMPDDHFRNRPPAYPTEAQVLGQHGEVVVVIHVAENGLAAGADVMESSGVRSLDEAALVAVRKWHFHPALKAGQAVPFDMPFRFIFEPY